MPNRMSDPFSINPMRLYSLVFVMVVGVISHGCDDQVSSNELEGSLGPQLIFELNDPVSSNGVVNEISFPLPNDSIFSVKDQEWQLTPSLTNSVFLSSWANKVSLLHGAPLHPLISLPLTQEIDLDELLLRQDSSSLLDDAIFLICLSETCVGELIPLDFGQKTQNYGLFAELNTLAEIDQRPSPSRLSPLSLPLSPLLQNAPAEIDSREPLLNELLHQYGDAHQDLSKITSLDSSAEGDSLSLIWTHTQQAQGQHVMTPSPSLGEGAVTLTFRPQHTLEANTRYGVILTKALRSSQGSLSQKIRGNANLLNMDLNRIQSFLATEGIAGEEILHTWTFTTGDPNIIQRLLRRSIDQSVNSEDELSQVISSLKPQLNVAHRWSTEESVAACESRGGLSCRVDSGQIALLSEGVRGLALAWAETKRQQETGQEISDQEKTALYESYRAVRGLFSGELSGWSIAKWSTPSSRSGIKAESRSWPFWCIIPESGEWINQDLQTQRRQAPYPLIMWSTDSMSERLDLLLHAGYFARAGYASCAVESTEVDSSSVAYQNLEATLISNLSQQWREYAWSPSLAISLLKPSQNKSLFRSSLLQRSRPLNRALGLQQVAHWIEYGDKTTPNPLSTLQMLIKSSSTHQVPNNSSVERQPEFPQGALVYGGTGEGATAAALSVSMDQNAKGLVAVDLVAHYLQHSAVGLGRGGSDAFLNRGLGPWLLWRASDGESPSGWSWGQDTLGSPQLSSMSPEEDTFSTPESQRWVDEGLPSDILVGKWVALYNHQTQQLGTKQRFDGIETPPLTVMTQRGDTLSLYVFAQQEDEEPTLISTSKLLAPLEGIGVAAHSEGARVLWRLQQWDHSIDEPFATSLLSTNEQARALLIAHPRSVLTPISSSLETAHRLGLFDDTSRQDLYNLSPSKFLMLSQAYEPKRAWGTPWVDWDDLDALTISEPSFTRNLELSLYRTAFLGGYHALKLPWRLHHRSGLGLPEDPQSPLETYQTNLVATFLNGLPRNASIEELDHMCLNYLVPSVRSCSFLSITQKDLEP